MIRHLWEHLAAMVLLASLAAWILDITGIVRVRRKLQYAVLIIALASLIPFAGFSLAGLVLGLSPSLSVAGTALWAMLLMKRLFRMEPLGGTLSISVLVASVSVPVAFTTFSGLGPAIYESGYGFTFWDIALGTTSVLLFIRGSRLSYVLLLCLAAHALGLMATSNIFDTLVDGPALLASLSVLAVTGLRRIRPLPNRLRV